MRYNNNVVIICDDACVSSTCQQTDCIVGSRASYHITPQRDMFTSYTDGSFGRVRMANQDVTEIVGIGSIDLAIDTGSRQVLRDLRRVSDIQLNIISIGELDDDSYMNYFCGGK